MIINLLINFVLLIIGTLFIFFPVVTMPSWFLTPLATIMGYWNSFLMIFPFAEILWDSLLYVIIPFELGLLIYKFFFGHRTNIQ